LENLEINGIVMSERFCKSRESVDVATDKTIGGLLWKR